MSITKIKKAVIREDLLSITGDYRKAIILNQFIQPLICCMVQQ